jgi:uncharacterized membrane protein
MNKNEFMERLLKRLRDNRVGDAEEIAAEYEAHFTMKLADGYSEEETAAKLGNPEELAEQFTPGQKLKIGGGRKAITLTGLTFTDIFAAMFFILLTAWVAVLGAFALAVAAVGICLFFGLNVRGLIPQMPFGCGLVFAVSLAALAVLAAVGTVYCGAFTAQLAKAYGRFHRNCVASASGKAVLPPLAAHPQFSAKGKRRFRKIALISLAVFAAAFVAAYIVAALSAGAFGFWHEWKWFVR